MCSILPFRGWPQPPQQRTLTWEAHEYLHSTDADFKSDTRLNGITRTRERWWTAHDANHSYEVHHAGGNAFYRVHVITERNGTVHVRKLCSCDSLADAQSKAQRYSNGEGEQTLFDD